MSYQFINNGATIKIEQDGQFVLLGKKSVLDITHIREDIIKIQTDDNCQGIYIRQSEVTLPEVNSAEELIYHLSLWIAEAVCNNSGTEETPPMR